MTTGHSSAILLGRMMLLSFWIALAVGVFLVILAFHESPPATSPGREVVTSEVHKGGFLLIRNATTRDKDCSGWVYRSIKDAEGVVILVQSEYRPRLNVVSGSIAARKLPIPEFAAPGKAEYRVAIEWSCNPIQRMWPTVIDLPTLYFTILKD